MRIVWELQGGALTFLELQRECDGMSSSTLTLRLRELTEASLIHHWDGGPYELTPLGAALPAAFGPLVRWAEQWADASATGQTDVDDPGPTDVGACQISAAPEPPDR